MTMANDADAIPASQPVFLQSLVAPRATGAASRVLAKTTGGTVTLVAFSHGQRLPAHTPPVDALALVLEGSLRLTIGDTPVVATPGTVVRLPAGVPHAVEATVASRMLLVLLRDLPR